VRAAKGKEAELESVQREVHGSKHKAFVHADKRLSLKRGFMHSSDTLLMEETYSTTPESMQTFSHSDGEKHA
jgi:hypothetical protein